MHDHAWMSNDVFAVKSKPDCAVSQHTTKFEQLFRSNFAKLLHLESSALRRGKFMIPSHAMTLAALPLNDMISQIRSGYLPCTC